MVGALSYLPSLTNEVVHTCPTIGSNVEEIVLQKTHFLMWDIGGQESLRSTWNTYYSNTEVRRRPGLEGLCVISQPLNLSEPWFPHCQMETVIMTSLGLP